MERNQREGKRGKEREREGKRREGEEGRSEILMSEVGGH